MVAPTSVHLYAYTLRIPPVCSLPQVMAPTLLIVGGDDVPVVRMNREALAAMRCERRLEIIPGATHLFEEPGALEQVARLARDWFTTHLTADARLPGGEPMHPGR